MGNKPRNNPKLTLTDKLIELMSWIIIIDVWIYTFKEYPDLYNIIPINYDSVGEPNKFGYKFNIFFYPIVNTALFILMAWINQFIDFYYYPKITNNENAQKKITFAIRLTRTIKLIIAIIFSFISISKIQLIKKNNAGLESWFIISFVCITSIVIVHLIVLIKDYLDKHPSFNSHLK
jgi:uncharacterized membrane protein